MRFLHTADWHAGKLLRGRSRIPELESVCAEILDVAVREEVDCLLFAGDLFDSHAPAPDAERVVYEFFAELLGRRIAAIIIGGNHDHPTRLGAMRRLLEPIDLFIRAEPAARVDGGVIRLTRRGEAANIAVLPFVPERKIIDICRMLDPEENWYAEYSDRVVQMCELLAGGFEQGTVNILLAHVHVHSAELSGTERAVHVAHPYAIDPKRFPANAQYVALGHLHRPQEVVSPVPCAYAGSPLQLDFGEQGQDKSIVLIDAQAGRPAALSFVPITAARRLQDVRGTLEQLAHREFGDDYLRVTVRAEAAIPGLADDVRRILPNAIDIRAEYPRKQESTAPDMTRLAPVDLFAHYYAAYKGVEPTQDLKQMFQQLYDEVMHEAG